MSPVPRSRLIPALFGIAALAMALAGCGSSSPRAQRVIGDPGGVAIRFTVDFTWQYLDTMGPLVTAYPNTYVAPSPYDGTPTLYYSAGYQHVFLLAGDGPAEDEVFHRRIHPGHHAFVALVTPGRTVTLSIQADGNRMGWKVIGHFTAAGQDGGRVHIILDADGSVLQVFPPAERSVAPADATTSADGQSVTPAVTNQPTAAPSAAAPVASSVTTAAPPPSAAAPAPTPVPAASEPAPVDPTADVPVPTQAVPTPPAQTPASGP